MDSEMMRVKGIRAADGREVAGGAAGNWAEEARAAGTDVHTYQCSRCQGFFDCEGSACVQCPYCAMLCDSVRCVTVNK